LFEAMLYPSEHSDGKVTLPVEVPISGAEPKAFMGLLRAIYSDKVDIDSNNIQDCIQLAKKYQIEKLQVVCAEFMEADVSIENVCELYELAPSLLDDKDFGLNFIEENTEQVLETEGFLKLSAPRLINLLESNELSVDEFALWKAVLKWGAAECKRQGKEGTTDQVKEVLTRITPLIRFPIMQLEDIAGQIAPSGFVSQEGLLELFRWVSITDEKERSATPCAFPTAARGGSSLARDSLILKDKKWKAGLLKLFGIGTGAGLKTDKPKLALLYRGSRDGFSASSFHARCDGKGNTLTVIKAQSQPNIFGAYTGESWRGASGTYGTARCWLFCLNPRGSMKPVKLESTSSGNNVYHNTSYGPTWGGGHDLHVNSSMRSTSNYCSPSNYRTIATGFDSISVDNNTLAGSYNFTVEEIEVFSVTNYTY